MTSGTQIPALNLGSSQSPIALAAKLKHPLLGSKGTFMHTGITLTDTEKAAGMIVHAFNSSTQVE